MAFESLADFWAMNGYAVYVWPAFGVVLGSLVAFALYSLLEQRRLLRHVAALERRERQRPTARAVTDDGETT
ncbi:heme exporter protein CcmD [Kushneria sp. Sum13]|uniref:heme exporter protein CcmD n=1 Tax=Kushneria sp. Sum13 TaxID=3459196 RepID=UPI0040453039